MDVRRFRTFVGVEVELETADTEDDGHSSTRGPRDGRLARLLQVIAAVNDAGVHEGGGFLAGGRDAFHSVPDFPFGARSLGRDGTRPYRIGFCGSLLGHARRITTGPDESNFAMPN
jgi:hypothetical protein